MTLSAWALGWQSQLWGWLLREQEGGHFTELEAVDKFLILSFCLRMIMIMHLRIHPDYLRT